MNTKVVRLHFNHPYLYPFPWRTLHKPGIIKFKVTFLNALFNLSIGL